MSAPGDPAHGAGAARHGGGGRARSAARLLAVQALYQIDINGGTPDAVVLEFIQFRAEEFEGEDFVAPADADRAMFADIVRGVARAREDLDALVGACLDSGRSVERLEPLLRAILLAGTYELRSRADVPMRVAISEYVDIADAFFEAKEPGLVNAVLDRVAHVLRPDEFDRAPERGDGTPA